MWWTPLLDGAVRVLVRTLRSRVDGHEPVDALIAARAPFVLAFWHGSMLWPWWRMRRHNAAALISRSHDGQMLADLLTAWGYTVVRGSSSRGAGEAMEQMRALVRSGHVLCITPDGPRGPRHAMKMGAVRVAQTTGVPLVFCHVRCERARALHSWDRFELPLPFSRIHITFTAPIMIAPALTGLDLDAFRASLEERVRALEPRDAGLEPLP